MARGIRAMNEWSFDGTLGQKNDPHTNPAGSMFTALPPDPQRHDQRGQQHREVRREADRAIAGSHRRRGGQQDQQRHGAVGHNPGAAPLFMQIGGVQGSARNNMSVISWSDDKGTIFPGYGIADAGLQQPHEPVRHGAREPGHLQGGPRQERHRLRARRPEQALRHQHELGGQAEADHVDRAAPLHGRHGHRLAPQCTMATATQARPDRDLDRQRHHEDREHLHGSRGADVALRQPTA